MSVNSQVFSPPAVLSAVSDALTDHDARLIFDLVSKVRKPSDVLAAYGLTPLDLAAKSQNTLWAQAYREAQRVWASDMNVQQRIRLKAAFLLEDSLIPLFKIITSDQMPVNAKLEAIEQLTKISTVANIPKDQLNGGEKHSVIINIGGGAPAVRVESGNDRATIESK